MLVAASGVAISELPSACGEVGRPSVDFVAKLALAAGGGFWVVGLTAALGARRSSSSGKGFTAVALLEGCVGIGLALYYQRHIGWYDRCG